ncbi:autotransporter outer membrane beta-barrel domain-containing protein [Comamonas sp.]|uniref:autotransporter outer membrane beta-barrel domain-containing protein n=1 Tax=Comamonas sp. TaxID=34028 RepID=UPI00283A8ECA|nr:autotransporter outer membrane beta-barrel domain-containing protein [Comamonas sp.]
MVTAPPSLSSIDEDRILTRTWSAVRKAGAVALLALPGLALAQSVTTSGAVNQRPSPNPSANWNVNGTLEVGSYGAGSLSILNGGTVSTSNSNTYIGMSDRTRRSDGRMTIDGQGSSFTGFNMYVGYTNSTGVVNVTNGGKLATKQFIVLGDTISSALLPASGTLTVDGAGSEVAAQELMVGANGDGSLIAKNGAKVVVNYLTQIGMYAGGSGSATISGAGTTFDSAIIRIGSSGPGTLVVEDQAHVTAPTVELGMNKGSKGEIKLNSSGVLTTGWLAKRSGDGSVTFDGGVLQLSANQSNLFQGFALGDVQLLAGGGTIDTQNFSVVNGLGLEGVGRLTKAGSGTLVLTEANTYTGGTTIAEGTLQLGNGGTSGSIVGDVVDNGTLAVNHSDTLTLDGVVSGSGALNQVGTGTTVLTGSNTYTGGTTIAKGTLQRGNGGTSGSIVGDVVDNGTLAVNRSDAFTLDGVVSGSGALNQLGTGTTVLTGSNTYTGGTTIAAGTLQLGNGGTSGSIVGGVVDNGMLKVNRSDAFTLDGVISGSGALNQVGTGTTVLAGSNTYTGGTTIAVGTLQLGNGGTSGSIVGDVANNGSLAVNRADTFKLDGAISGTGSFKQMGAGTTVLAGANSYTGVTDVLQGTLAAGAHNAFSRNSAYDVAAGAMLDLAGYDQTLSSLSNSGTVRLHGNTPGTVLKVTGPYVGNDGTLQVGTVLGTDDSASDKVLLSGSTSIASGHTSVQVTNVGGLGALTTGNGIAVIETENGASLQPGSFTLAGEHVDAGAYEYRLYQTAQGASLKSTITPPPLPPQPPAPEPSPTPEPSPEPEPVVAYRPEVPLLSALPAQLRQADLAMLGDWHKRMGDDSAQSATGQGRRAWGRVLRTDPTIRQQGTVSPESRGHMTGFQAGLDLYADQNVRAGLYVGQLDGDMSTTGFASGVEHKYVGFNTLRSRYLGLYGTWQDASGLYVDAVLQGADYRSVLHTAEDRSEATTKGSGWLASLEVGKPYALNHQWQVGPQAQIIYRQMSLDDTALSSTTVQNQAANDWMLRLGARVKGSFATSVGHLQPYGRINFYKANNSTDVTRFITPAATTGISARTGYMATELAAGASLQLSPRTSIYGELGKLWSSGGDSRVNSGVQASIGVKVLW